jgi:hypothetical protein
MARYLERADWFFTYVVSKLGTFKTKSLCRPVILMLNFGWSHAWWQQNPTASAPAPTEPVFKTAPWRMFVPQKAIAMRRAKLLMAAGGMVTLGLTAAAMVWWLG